MCVHVRVYTLLCACILLHVHVLQRAAEALFVQSGTACYSNPSGPMGAQSPLYYSNTWRLEARLPVKPVALTLYRLQPSPC